MSQIDDTHDPALASWVESANDPSTDFPIQNLPFGRFRGSDGTLHVGVAIGDRILDLNRSGLAEGGIDGLMKQGAEARRRLRLALSRALRSGAEDQHTLAACLVAQSDVELALPCDVGDYTDFFTGIHHATAVGKLFRPDNPLLPNYKWVPIGYHGRASSLVASGRPVRRPIGQAAPVDSETPRFGPTRRLDYELELAAFVGAGNALGTPVPITEAEQHLFGLGLLNDWSARDIQAWEYQPLGPFLAKSFATTLSPWIVTVEALAPFRAPFERPAGDPVPLPYLDSKGNRERGAFDITLEVWLQTGAMRAAGVAAARLMQSNARDAYWTIAQLIAHHTVNGCNLRSGDILATGTLSGPNADQGGSLLELSAGGKRPLQLANGESRTFLEDGDTVILRAHCERKGFRRIGFGDCAATVLPALTA